MAQSLMRITICSPATGSNFFPCGKIISRLIQVLQNEHVLFLAPRRTGKTSVLLYLQRVAPAKVVFLDLEGFDHPDLWIKSMINALGDIKDEIWVQKLKSLKNFMPRLRSDLIEIAEANWEEKANNLLKALNELNEPVWFLFDEFPIMIDNIAHKHGTSLASAAMHWLRRVRQENVESSVRFLLTGSIGLDSVLQRHGLRGAANDLRRETLPPLSPEEALQFALRLAGDNQIPLSEQVAKAYIDRLGPAVWPYFIQLFIAELQERAANPEHGHDVAVSYQAVAFGEHNQFSSNMWTRLRDIFNDAELDIAQKLLKTIASRDKGVSLTELRVQLPELDEDDFSYVLDVLQHDGYLFEDGNAHLCFFSNLLRDYWRRKGHL
ncbi:MAG: ATP-binding protein [Nitrosomonas sp.]|nr:ATP-binding protein [Nitrosomonas sp.]